MESKYTKIIFPFLFFFLYANSNLQTGDIILRKESNILSDLFALIDPCGYSHTGLIIIKNHTPFVCHIEYDTTKNNIKIIPLKKFLSHASAYIILKPKMQINKLRIKKIVNSLKSKNIRFDTEISLNNNKFYCTELVDYIYYKLLNKHIYAYLYTFKHKKIITVRSLLKSKYFKIIK